MNQLRVSIVMPSYNHARYIGAAIESVLSQNGPFTIELLVYDGGSDDGTQDILAQFGNAIWWQSQADGGQIAAINVGLQRATGDLVGWLNSDDLLLPEAISKVTATFQNDIQCNWLHGGCRIIDEHGHEIRRWVSAYKRWHARRYSFRSLLQKNFISQMSVFWRRRIVDEIGFLDPSFPLAFDYEYWVQLAKRWPPLYIDEPLAAFRWYDTSKSGANFEQQFAENERAATLHGLERNGQQFSKRLLNRSYIAAYRLAARFGR